MIFYFYCRKCLKLFSLFSRDDKIEPLKTYTDPSFFFNNWRKKVSIANDELKAEKRRKVNKSD